VTIDNTPPTSSVTALPANDPATTFPVSWSGSDGGGSGIASYTIYASVNGGAFSPWLADTAQTTADYTGTIGNSYAFYSVATDNVGNVEAQHVSADTQTTLIANTMTPVVSAGSNQTIAGLTLSRSGSFADTDSGDSWTATVDYGDGTGAQTLTLNSDKTFTLSHTYALDGTYNITVNVIDADNHDGSAQFTVIMDSTPPAATLGNVSTATAGASSVTFSVTYTDVNGVDTTTLGGGAITVTLPNGNSVTANLQSQSGSGSSVSATYAMSAPSGTFSANDNGTYTIKLAAGSVKDVPGNAVVAETLGTFSIALSGGNNGGGSTSDTTPPTATVASVGTPTIDTTTLSFVVDFSDDVSLNTNSIATGDIIVTGPGNFSQVATLISGPSSSSATAATATFQITAPGGFFTDADNGNYTISLDDGTLLDTAGNVAAAATIGSFTANIAAPASLPDLTGTISSIPTTVLPLSKKNVVVINVSNSGAKPIKGNVPFTLYAYTGTFNASAAIPLSSGILKVNLKNGFSKAFSESFVAPTSVSTGDYHIAAVLDPHDTISEEYKSNNTILSGGTSHFEAPTVDVGITFAPPGAISTIKKSKVSVNITNHGNVTASGTGTIQLPGKFSLKAGASKKYSVTVANDASLKGEQEYLIAVVSYSGSPADDNAANNTVFSSSQVSFT
jgi:hypothetical protein